MEIANVCIQITFKTINYFHYPELWKKYVTQKTGSRATTVVLDSYEEQMLAVYVDSSKDMAGV